MKERNPWTWQVTNYHTMWELRGRVAQQKKRGGLEGEDYVMIQSLKHPTMFAVFTKGERIFTKANRRKSYRINRW